MMMNHSDSVTTINSFVAEIIDMEILNEHIRVLIDLQKTGAGMQVIFLLCLVS